MLARLSSYSFSVSEKRVEEKIVWKTVIVNYTLLVLFTRFFTLRFLWGQQVQKICFVVVCEGDLKLQALSIES